MNRKELYEYIKTHNLKDEATRAARRYSGNNGANYTNLPTYALASFVENHRAKCLEKNTNKVGLVKTKVETALDRMACFDIIKKNNWQDAVKNAFGKNFVSVSTDNLNKFLETMRQAEQPSTSASCKNHETTNGCIDAECRKVLKAVCALINAKDIASKL